MGGATMKIDKKLHMLIGFAIGMVLGFLIHPYAGLAASVVAGVAKEVWDKYNGGDSDFIGDVAATVIGGGFGAFLASELPKLLLLI